MDNYVNKGKISTIEDEEHATVIPSFSDTPVTIKLIIPFFLKRCLFGGDCRLRLPRVFEECGNVRILYSFVFHLLHLAHNAVFHTINSVGDRHGRLSVRYEYNALFALLFGERF